MEILNTIFGGKTRVRIMRLFLLNPDKVYGVKSVIAGSRGKQREVERELASFEKAGIIKPRRFYAEVKQKRNRKQKRVPLLGWMLNPSFIYVRELRSLLVNDLLTKNHNVAKRLGRGGHLKLVVLAGIFIQNWESRVDLLVVGDTLHRGVLERIIRSLETEIGRELHYAILETSDFQYRMSIGDRLVRDIFDYPHQTVLNKGLIAE